MFINNNAFLLTQEILEHFAIKRRPVIRNKMRQHKYIDHFWILPNEKTV